jgi:hypothetical protein
MFTVLGAYHLVKELQDNKGGGGQCSYQEQGKEVRNGSVSSRGGAPSGEDFYVEVF